MTDILIATLGEAAPAVSFAFERWSEFRPNAELAIIHTDPVQSRINIALSRLKQFFPSEYPGVRVHWHEIRRYINGTGYPLTDIDDDEAAWDYFRGVFEVLCIYRDQGFRLHVLVAGGRKAMTFYASTAAAALFKETGDQLWTVHSPKDLIELNTLAIPTGRKNHVQLINLPILPARLSDEELERLSRDPESYFAGRMENRLRFMGILTPAERKLAEAFRETPYADNASLATKLNIETKSVETKFTALYTKMAAFVPVAEISDNTRKRLMLADLLRGLLD